MSNPLDRHLETLRSAQPRPEAVDRAVASLRRSHPPRLVPLTAGVAALSAFLLWPRPGNGYAWAQIADQSLPPRYHERTVIVSGGAALPTHEVWVDRLADAERTRNAVPQPPGKAGGKTAFVLTHDTEFILSRKGFYVSLHGTATFSRKPRPHGPYDFRDGLANRIDVQRILDDKTLRQLGVDRDIETRVGRADRYRLDMPSTVWDASTKTYREVRRDAYTVYVQPGTKRILGYDLVGPNATWQTTVEYPDRFPADTFAFPRPGVPAYDVDAIDAWARGRLKTPMAILRAGGQTSQLRLVVQGVRHQLWTLWTGGKPNGDLAHKVQILGMKNGYAYGLAGFSARSHTGDPYGGHAVMLDRKVDRVDLRIPVFAPGSPRSRFVGYATVRGIAVKQIPDIDVVWAALGVEAPIR